MKKAIFTLSLLVVAMIGFNSFAQEVGANGPVISIDKEVHDYGTMEQGGNGECVFVVTNTGNQPLILSRCKGSCGCTVPQWPREAVAPGQTGEIKVKYDTKRIGIINKSVTIQSNAVNSPTKIIRIKGEIKAPNATATPVKPVQGPVSSPAE